MGQGWHKADGRMLCIGCLEQRLGRRLTPKDFNRKQPLNPLPGTALIAFVGLTLLQVSYLIGAVVSEEPKLHQASGHQPKQQMLQTVQMAIASELQIHFVVESLDDLPQHLRAKVAMLESR